MSGETLGSAGFVLGGSLLEESFFGPMPISDTYNAPTTTPGAPGPGPAESLLEQLQMPASIPPKPGKPGADTRSRVEWGKELPGDAEQTASEAKAATVIDPLLAQIDEQIQSVAGCIQTITQESAHDLPVAIRNALYQAHGCIENSQEPLSACSSTVIIPRDDLPFMQSSVVSLQISVQGVKMNLSGSTEAMSTIRDNVSRVVGTLDMLIAKQRVIVEQNEPFKSDPMKGESATRKVKEANQNIDRLSKSIGWLSNASECLFQSVTLVETYQSRM